MTRWPAVRLGDLVAISGGGTPTRTNDAYYGGPIPWVTPKDMKRWEIRDAQIRLTEAGLAKSPGRLVPKDSVLLVVRSGVLKHSLPVALNRVPVAINQDMKALRCETGTDADYLARFIKSRSAEVLSWVRATTADNFPIEMLKDLDVPLPPVEEQRRIADILDRADALRTKRREAFAYLDDLTQSIFLEMFGAPASSPFVTELRNVVRPATGSTPSRSHSDNFGGTTPWVKTAEVTGGVITSTDEAVTERGLADARLRVYPKGSILIALYGQGRTRGQCAILGVPAATNQACAVLQPGSYDSGFMFVQLRLAYERLRAMARGGNQANLNLQLVGSLPVIAPPLGDQRRFATRSVTIDTLRSKATDQLRQLDDLFASLQQRAFSGLL